MLEVKFYDEVEADRRAKKEGDGDMKKPKIIALCIFLIAIIVSVVWYKTPVCLTKLNAGDVCEIAIRHGGSGKELIITERDKIERIIGDFNSVRMKRNGTSSGYKGWCFLIKIYQADGKKVSGRNDFFINSGDVIKDDPFFYKVVEGNTDFEYIAELYDLRIE